MNIFKLRVANLHLDVIPAGKVVTRETVNGQVEANAIIARTRSNAARILYTARRVRAEARRQARDCLAEAEIAAKVHAEEAATAAAREAVAGALCWTVQANQLEETLAKRVEKQCRDLVRRVVTQFAGESDRGALIAQRVAAELNQMKSHDALNIYVAPSEAEDVRRAVAVASDAPLTIHIDALLPPGSARLESPYLSIALDLNAHLRLLLDTLNAPNERS